ncbi:MAG TPA: trifunctional glycosyltransferase/class I SAM-dependent methyltransferase/polysaccharide deacetylase [Thermoleophilaceae bacterium]|nr:trifunctional glycosyltransferase/class I SAM-dependent methyltransferase/polysaccharide deacetylase [Thermoleophilaceae bacterium]
MDRLTTGAVDRDESVEAPVVTVVIPAYNAEQTVAAALDSLQAQTLTAWEAVVVDDGSTDDTAALVEAQASRDSRVRLVHQANAGVSAARNAGIEAARAGWLVFLDADDWLAPEALARLHEALAERPQLDAVHCGWTRIAPDGRQVEEICPRSEEDMFGWHAHNCAFAIHAVMVRRELVRRAGGFDPDLSTCEDWDLWMRLSRLGASWGRVDAQLAYYRMRKASASMASRQLLDDGLVVIDRAHGPDARLDHEPHERCDGEDVGQRTRARLVHAVYSAALALGQGHDAVAMLDAVAGDRCEDLGSSDVAYALFDAVPLGAGTISSDWPSFSTELVDHVARFLDRLERISGAPQLALRTKRMLERLVADGGTTSSLFGRIDAAAVDLERPLSDIAVAEGTERLLVQPSYGGLALQKLELPAFDGRVPASLVADAVVAEQAWELLGAFLGATVARELDVGRGDGRLVVRRRGHTLVDESVESDRPLEQVVHDYAGWELLLQEVCGDPETGNAAFYDAAHDDELVPAGRERASGGWAAVELSAPLPEILGEGTLRVAAGVGGATLAAVEVEPVDGRVTAGALRREICTQAGFELCRLAVREGLIGRPLLDGSTLRERLRAAAAARAAVPAAAAAAPEGSSLAPGWERHATRALEGADSGYVIARRRGAVTGLSGSRAAAVPRAAASEAVAAARAAGDPVIEVGEPAPGAAAIYAPDIVWDGRSLEDSHAVEPPVPATDAGVRPGPGRAFFEALFASGADPWGYTSEYEQGKYDQTLSLIDARPERALELACAEGHFTRQLAPHVERLVASDVSTVALRRARQRCADLDNVDFEYHDLFSDPIAGRYDLIVCSEVLYYAGDRDRLDHAARSIAAALAPDGSFVGAHANLLVDDPGKPGFDWDVPFGARVIEEALTSAGLERVRELANPLYRVQAYRHAPRRLPWRRRTRPRREQASLPASLPRVVEERFRWQGGTPTPTPGSGEPVSWELPILMYHRVAPTGHERLREWRLTPDQFEAQLHYLRTAGYGSASFEEWRQAAERHEPLPGRRVMLTFDDGYEDFAEHAYPLLRQYELEATVFLVSERVGLTNEWDRGYGETVPLMDWDTIRALDGHGVEFGGHSASHPMLTALGLDEVVREASRCRAQLVEQLGHLVRPFAYPYGDTDAAVARMVGACGFEYGVTTAGYAASASIPMLSLPRIDVPGTSSFDDFVRTLAPVG